jgi:hypothetical protein
MNHERQEELIMHKAAELADKLRQVDVADGMKIIEVSTAGALHFDVIDDAMCIMHSDGSATIIDHMGKGAMTVESISSENILKVLKHYRPFKGLFKNQIQ